MTTFTIGRHVVARIGYGAMQLTGPGVFGPPADRAEALAVLRTAVEAGVNHIDTAEYYGPTVVFSFPGAGALTLCPPRTRCRPTLTNRLRRHRQDRLRCVLARA